MLDLKWVREHLDVVEEALEHRNSKVDLTRFKELDASRRELIVEVEQLKNRRNVVSGEIARLKKTGEPAEDKIVAMRELGDKIKGLDEQLAEIEDELNRMLLDIPNIPDKSVPIGFDETANVVIRTWGEKPEFDFEPKPHWDTGIDLGILDFERASKIAKARFVLYWDLGARMERSLINLMLDMHTGKHGYTEVFPPILVNSASLTGTGQLPKFKEDLFKVEGEDLYLIPTAEVPVTNVHRDEILAADDLPRYYCAYTPCFRSEAGAYGKDTRGLIRHHQFNKVELVKFVNPETSYDELEKLTANAESILQALNIHYRVVALSTGDMGFSSAKTYDIEVWLPGSGGYREISSCSNFEDFQARRANIRFRENPKAKPRFVHTLNGSGLAIGRTVAAVLENYQQADGAVSIPDALKAYMGGAEVITPKKF
ncbi:MAG: serine--tRNA ligase [Candidatus Aquicultor secundus]|uniref:Serine--tRNA ligase n=1 Tax=Candidatus Aquicultor secundus TaxID=1973895 RepID=A0A2M7T6Y1_9ACTN|nr:serine--tRNA ligase [Candidatus Aquicultor secundus]NCO65100.1 serine--tRNA ligase [Solirubrobacter sp.]OIO88228.1 MAG: serine--tRNA ligase [Candidatus Aquicultor secundus]PIU27853.1 MAG: serine--tRNA ligase [Candidatus Aquicultor secundus]PIW21969.1 MAG: serine--tRNA ligase [Candidatus Aquicultor secundus]PIX51350.1 MAG: serine--tRNA ligase [Candidatus Aquicultor secundus]